MRGTPGTPANATCCRDACVHSRSADTGHADFLEQVRARDGGRRIGRQLGHEPGVREGRAKRFGRFPYRVVRPAPLHGRTRRCLSVRRYRRRAWRGPSPTQAGRPSERPSVLLRVEARTHPRNLYQPASRADRRRELRRRRGGRPGAARDARLRQWRRRGCACSRPHGAFAAQPRQSLSDQWLGVVNGRLSTRLPTQSVEKPRVARGTSHVARRQAGSGKRTVTVSPRPPRVVPSATVARCCSAIRLTIDSPSPLPDDVTACAPSPR